MIQSFDFLKLVDIIFLLYTNWRTWRHRLVVRTSGFHPGNRGSIPLGATTQIHAPAYESASNRVVFFSLRMNLGPFPKNFFSRLALPAANLCLLSTIFGCPFAAKPQLLKLKPIHKQFEAALQLGLS